MVDAEGVLVLERNRAPFEVLALLDGHKCEDGGYVCSGMDNIAAHHKRRHR